jgi:hypothetical protein
MPKKPKEALDCVQMKNEIQARILAEYESRKTEFPSFIDFVNATADASPLGQEIKRKLRKAQKGK